MFGHAPLHGAGAPAVHAVGYTPRSGVSAHTRLARTHARDGVGVTDGVGDADTHVCGELRVHEVAHAG